MAYFYKHLKSYTTSGSKTYIDLDWVDKATSTTYTDVDNTGMNTPYITATYINSSVNKFGNIITSNMTAGKIANPFSFLSTTSFGDTAAFQGNVIIKKENATPYLFTNSIRFNNSNNTQDVIQYSTSNNNLIIATTHSLTLGYGTVPIQDGDIKQNANKLVFNSQQVKCEASGSIGFWTSKYGKDDDHLYNNPISFAVRSGSSYYGFYIAGSSASASQVYFNIALNATYFNATSDKRAKHNIHQSEFSALDIIKKLPIYNFNYNNDNSAAIGLIAQEAAEVQAGDFELVSNKEASGKGDDLMRIKESKLVYIAWKAIQEQQEIIEALKKEIEELKAKK